MSFENEIMSFESEHNFEITCPYCFRKMLDCEVLFRSEKVNQGEPDILPDEYDDMEDFQARYRGPDKEKILSKYYDWEFFAETEDPVYEAFWANFNGTTEYNPADEVLRVKAYRRRIIDPAKQAHQKYLKKQDNGDYFIYDDQGMVTQIELVTGETCNRRVCRHCHNPLPDNYGKHTVKFATVVGITGAGKTVYLSQLLKRMKTYAVKVGLSAIVNNTGVRTFLENNAILANEPLPGSTPATRFQQPLFYEMVRDAKEYGRVTETFVLYDVAGEVFTSSSLVNKFAPFVEHADGVIVLIDPMQFDVVSGVMNHGNRLDEPATVLDIMQTIWCRNRDNEKCDIPFAVCISKADTQAVQNVLSENLKRMLLDDVHGIKDESGFNRPLFNAQEYNPILNELYKFIQSNELVLAQQMQTNYSTYGGYSVVVNGIRRLSQIESPNWKSRDIRQMAVEIARALESINRSGYFYADIHLSRFYFSTNGSVYLDFSNLIYSVKDTVGAEAKEICHLEPAEYPVEFADPAVVRGLIPNVDFHSQNYSVCALFFYLFLGQYAYDGRLLTGYADDTIQTHYVKFRDYHKMPVFIFDPKDDQNALGAFFEEQQVIDLWNELPNVLKTLFVKTLRQENAERKTSVNNPTPSMWLKIFEELGWCEQRGNVE